MINIINQETLKENKKKSSHKIHLSGTNLDSTLPRDLLLPT